MQGVPVNFTHQHDRADFRALPGQPATELYRAHIQHHIFDPHSHEGFGLGVIECGAERFRYRGSQLLAGPGSLVLMNPDELHTGESACEQGWRYRMLYLPADAGRPERIQGSFLSDDEAQALTKYWQQQIIEHAIAVGTDPQQAQEQTKVEPGWELDTEQNDEFDLEDDLLDRAEEVVREYGRASISLLQRRLKVGYSRAARLIDLLEEHGIIGQPEPGGKAREVYSSAGNDHGDEEGTSMAHVAQDIKDEEQQRNNFLRKQAARHGNNAASRAPIDEDE